MKVLVELVRERTRDETGDGEGPAAVMRLEALPRTEGFFRRHGFRTVERTRDHYGPGLDRVEMRRHLESRSSDPPHRESGP